MVKNAGGNKQKKQGDINRVQNKLLIMLTMIITRIGSKFGIWSMDTVHTVPQACEPDPQTKCLAYKWPTSNNTS